MNGKKEVTSRSFKNLDMTLFRNELKKLIDDSSSDKMPMTIDNFNSICKSLIDKYAPLKTRKVTDRTSSPWFSLEEKEAKRKRRQAERTWKKSGLTIHKDIFIHLKNKVNAMCQQAKKLYFSSKFKCVKSCKDMYRLTNILFNNKHDPLFPTDVPLSDLPNNFSSFFTEKVEKIRESLPCTESADYLDTPFSGVILDDFNTVSESDVIKIISESASKSCELDSLPTPLLKECISDLIPHITNFINSSLSSGTVPDAFKVSLVNPLLKKIGLDSNQLNNYRPVSNLTFLSKILEKVVLKQLLGHISQNGLDEVYQSAYKKHHSTETALLRVFNDLLNGIDTGNICVINLLDLSAAFDTIDHDILLSRLEMSFGISGTALSWFKSYLSGRKQKVKVQDFYSDEITVNFGVPQGSVLGPVLFTLYILPLSNIIKISSLNFHSYADDNQLYKSVKIEDVHLQVNKSSECITSIKCWMNKNKLKLNETKTEYMIAGKASLLRKCNKPSLFVNDSGIEPTAHVKNLGVLFDEELSLSPHITSLCNQMFMQIRKICLCRKFLPDDVVVQLMVSLVLSKMDYCNSLFTGLPKTLLDKLQRVQNCAAKICLHKRKFDHVTPLLKSLHWLPVNERIEYKIATLCHKHFLGTLPIYLSNLLNEPNRTRTLRSAADKTILFKPLKNLKSYGERSFQYAGPSVWNALPREIREIESHDSFKRAIKHFLFVKAYYD